MRAPAHIISVITIAILLPSACSEKAAEPAPVTTLMRPVLVLDTRAGQILVPQSALVERGGVPGVLVLDDESRARFRMVRTGKTIQGRVEILSGLGGNESLVTGDLREVRDGSPIKHLPAAKGRG